MTITIQYATDDVAPRVGNVGFGQYTNDTTPLIRVTFDALAAGDRLVVSDQLQYGQALGAIGAVTLSAGDVAAGFADIAVSGLPDGWNILTASAGSAGTATIFALGVAAAAPSAPVIQAVTDDAGSRTGPVAQGGATDDATPTVTVFEAGLPPTPTSSPGHAPYGGPAVFDGIVNLYDGDTLVGHATMGYDGLVSIATGALSPGRHSLTAVMVDRAGNVSANSGAFAFTVGPDAPPGDGGQLLIAAHPGDTLAGGAGADTLVASQGSDILTGGGGADVFQFKALPWNAGHVTDFTPGSDRLDLNTLFQAGGYAGSNPIADGYVSLQDDGAGGTRVFYDPDGPAPGNSIHFLITDLDHVSATGLTWARLSGGSVADTAPGLILTSSGYGASLTGAAGDDTLIAGQGPDVLTGKGGADDFVFRALPWNAGHIADFAVGADRVDLSALLHASGYAGSDPIADGYVSLQSDGAGGTEVLFDTDGRASGNTLQFRITDLDHVAPAGLTWSQLTGGPAGSGGAASGAGGDGSAAGQVLTASGYAATLSGGAGPDTINAGQGPDQLSGGAGDDRFVFAHLPWNAGDIADFSPGRDILDLRSLFGAAGYTGGNPLADHWLTLKADGAGGTQVYVDADGPGGAQWPTLITTLDHVAPGQLTAGDWLFH